MHTKWLNVLVLAALLLGLLPTAALAQTTAAAPATTELTQEQILEKIDPELLNELTAQGQADYFIWMTEEADLNALQAGIKAA